MTVTRRLTLFTLAAGLLFVAAPALAKVPPFSVEVSPGGPIAGEPTTVTVELAEPIPVDDLSGLIAFYRASDAESRVNGIPVPLERVGATTYQGDVVLPESGEWRIVSFPDRTGWSTDEVLASYPDQIPVYVVSAGGSNSTAAVVAVAAFLAIAVVLVGRSVRSHRLG